MIPDNFSVVDEYIANPTDNYITYQMLTQGITAIREFTKTSNLEGMVLPMLKDMKGNAIVRQLLAHGVLIRLVEDAQTYKDMKASLLTYRQNFLGDPSDTWAVEFAAHIEYLFQTIRGQQKDAKALEESVVCACRPIVPYVGVLKKPFVDERVETDEDDEEDLEWASIESWRGIDIIHMRYVALCTMSDMVMNHRIVDDLLVNYQMISAEQFATSDMSTMVHLAIGVDSNPKLKNHRSVIVYMLWGFTYQYLGTHAQGGKPCNRLFTMVNDLTKSTFDEIYKSALDDTPANEASLMQELDNYDMMDKFMKAPMEEEPVEQNPATHLESFDLSPLMNFIYTNRRFRSNKYSNMAFMNMPNIGGYVYYKEFLIIEPKSDSGAALDYLYCPVIDDLNGSKAAVIKYWRDGRIDLLSQAQYIAEVGTENG